MSAFHAAAAIVFLLCAAASAQAATSIWSNTVGGFPTWYGSPTFSSNAYTLAAPLPTWPPYGLVTQQHVRIVVPASGTNTGAATLLGFSLPSGFSALRTDSQARIAAGNLYNASPGTFNQWQCQTTL